MKIPKISKPIISPAFPKNFSKKQEQNFLGANFDVFETQKDVHLNEINSFLNQESNSKNPEIVSAVKNISKDVETSIKEAYFDISTRKKALKPENIDFIVDEAIKKHGNACADKKHLKECLLLNSKINFEENQDNLALKKIYRALIFAFLRSLIKEENTFEDKVNLFKREFLDYASANQVLSLSYMQDLIQAFSPKTKLKKQSFFKNFFTYQSGAAVGAYMRKETKNKIEIIELPKKICIQTNLDKDSLMRLIVHEMTHILQYDSPEKSYTKEIERKANENPKDMESLFAGEEIFYSSEEEIYSLFYKSIFKNSKLPQNYSKNNLKLSDAFVEEMDEIIEKTIKKYSKKIPDFNLKAALSITRILIVSEIEAYQNEMSFNIDKLDKETIFERTMILKMYAKMIENIDKRLA